MKSFKYLLAAAGMLFLIQCSPKMTDGAKSSDVKDVVENMKSKDFRSTPPEAGPARDIKIGTYDNFTLDNGLKVIVVENHKIPRVSFQLFIDKDDALENEKAGLASMAGDILSKGTKSKTKAEIDESVDYIGASMSTNSRGGFASSLTKHSDKIMTLFSDAILNPSFPEAEFEKMKTQTISGLQSDKDDPGAISRKVSSVISYGKDHPYGEVTTELTVQNITLDDTKKYYDTYFKPNASYMVVVGDITPAKAKDMVNKYFGQWKKGNIPTHEYATPVAPSSTNVSFVDKPGAVQSVINITYPINLKPGADDGIPARVLNNILGGGFSSRLFTNLREDKAYTYGAGSSISSDEIVGTFSANASVRNEVTDSSMTEFMYELGKISEEQVTAQELNLAKNAIAGSFARSLESPQTVARFALNTFRYGLPKDYYNKYLATLDAVNAADVLRVAKKFVRPNNANVVIVGNQDEVADKLKRFASNGQVDMYDFSGKKKKTSSMGSIDVSANDVIMSYIKSIGGKDALKAIKNMKTKMSMDMMGQAVDVSISQKPPMFLMSMNMTGMTIVKQVYDGNKGLVEQMGQKQVVEGEEAKMMAGQGKLFTELEYFESPYSMEMKGVEDLDGVSTYKIIVTNEDGTKATEYYSVDSGHKVKAINTMKQMGQSVTTTSEYKDYKEVNGILIPHLVKITGGGAPAPMEMKVKSVEMNVDMDPDLFKIE